MDALSVSEAAIRADEREKCAREIEAYARAKAAKLTDEHTEEWATHVKAEAWDWMCAAALLRKNAT